MAVGYVQGKAIRIASGLSSTGTITPTAGNLLTSGHFDSKTVGNTDTLSISDDRPNTWVNIGTANVGETDKTMMTSYAANVGGVLTTVTVTHTETNTLRAIIEEWSGVATSSPLGDSGQSGNTANVAASSVATTTSTLVAVGDLVVTWLGTNGDHTYIVGTLSPGGATQTLGQADVAAPTTRLISEWAACAGTGAQTGTFSWGGSTSTYESNIATFKAAVPFDPTATRAPDDYGVTDAGMLMPFVSMRGF